MVDSVELLSVANDAGFRKRIQYFMCKKARAVLAEVTPDANELILAKLMLFPATTNSASVDGVVGDFACGVVTVDAIANALIANGFQHTAFADATFETQVNNFWPTYAKSVA